MLGYTKSPFRGGRFWVLEAGDDTKVGDWCEEGEKGPAKRDLVGFTL